MKKTLDEIIGVAIKDYLLCEARTSGSHFADQIQAITSKVVDKLNKRDYKSMYVPITISLESFFADCREEYLKPEDYEIGIYFLQDEDVHGDDVVEGDFSMRRESPIHIEVHKEASREKIYSTIEHEVTHLVDFLIARCKHIGKYYNYCLDDMTYRLPPHIAWILYHLWSTTEFNAFKSSTQKQKDKYFEELMRNIEDAYYDNDVSLWEEVKKYAACTDKIYNMRPLQFKTYFIKTSLKRLKKYVKKYY